MSWNGPSPSTLGWLECSRCSAAYDVEKLQTLCTKCDGVLFARYRLDEAARTLQPAALLSRPYNQWRYAEILPGSDAPITLGEGMTPLLQASFLAQANGLERLFIKDEALNPTGSFKARGMSAAVTMAHRLGVRRLALPSAGNTPEPFRLEAGVYGAGVHLVDGDITDCGARMREAVGSEDWFDLSTLREPYRLEGKKTMGYELAEQFDWQLPDVIIYPTGGGTGLIGMWKAFEEMEQLGLLREQARPRMVAVQAAGCAPIVRAFEQGASKAARWEEPRTYACGLQVPSAIGDELILSALRESGGTAVAVSDREMASAQLEMARGEGIFPAPEGGATYAALQKLCARQWIDPAESVLLFNTGSGLKYPRIPGLKIP